MTIIRFLPALLLAALPHLHAADQVPTVPAGAGNRFELRLDPKTKIRGLTAPQVAQFRQRIDALTGYLRSLEAVNSPPPPLCMRLSSWLEMGVETGKAAAAVIDAHYPISFDAGKCHRMTGAGVTFHVNHDTRLFTNNYLLPGDGSTYYYTIPLASVSGRIARLRDGTIVLMREGLLPWRPVDRRQFIEKKVARMTENFAKADEAERGLRDMMTKLGKPMPVPKPREVAHQKEQRALLERLKGELAAGVSGAPVCLNQFGEMVDGPCGLEWAVVEPNPAYWNARTPERIQLLVIATDQTQLMQESKEKFDLRIGVYRALDIPRLLAMVEP